jgi:selenocysteine-specific elongation factor
VRRYVLGTAGHVDHGKTSLVRALTGIETDRLPEEKRRGITIELGFAPLRLGDVEVSVIDVPGHRKLVHTMIAGAAGMELVLLVVAADEGVMPQTREHVAACELLGIRRAVIAVTKLDRVGPELAELAGEEARELLGDRFEAVDVVACSSRTGEGVDAVRDALRRAIDRLGAPPASSRARLSVDRVFSVKGAGTVVTGTLVEGRLAVGAPLVVVGEAGARETVARGLHVHDHAVDVADAPCRLAVNLAQLSLDDVRRGDVVTTDVLVAPTRALDVWLRADRAPRSGQSAQVYLGTARSTARIDAIGPFEDGRGFARLRLGAPLVAVGGDRFVLRGSDIDGPAGAVIGGGVVLDGRPPRTRPRDKRRAVLEALRDTDAARAVRALVAERSPKPLLSATLGARFVIDARDLLRGAEALTTHHELARVKAGGFMAEPKLLELAGRARALVLDHQRARPLDRGLALETLRQRLAMIAGPDATEEIIRAAVSKRPAIAGEPIVVEGDIARVASVVEGGSAVAAAVVAATRALAEAGLKGVSEHAVREASGASAKDVKAILAKLVREGTALHAGELWFSRAAYDELAARVAAHLDGSPKLTIADFKELSGLGRKQAIPLLEQLDRDGVTRRDGDDRVAGPKRAAAPASA